MREMNDEDAYMALALHNVQSELHLLEVGLHALGSGLSVRVYAERAGVHERTLQDGTKAAEVVGICTVPFIPPTGARSPRSTPHGCGGRWWPPRGDWGKLGRARR
jgi:hypothetical protein